MWAYASLQPDPSLTYNSESQTDGNGEEGTEGRQTQDGALTSYAPTTTVANYLKQLLKVRYCFAGDTHMHTRVQPRARTHIHTHYWGGVCMLAHVSSRAHTHTHTHARWTDSFQFVCVSCDVCVTLCDLV